MIIIIRYFVSMFKYLNFATTIKLQNQIKSNQIKFIFDTQYNTNKSDLREPRSWNFGNLNATTVAIQEDRNALNWATMKLNNLVKLVVPLNGVIASIIQFNFQE